MADIFRRHGAAYRDHHAGHLDRSVLRVMGAIEACRTAALGGHVERCGGCGHTQIAFNSCRNRHCPKCQAGAARDWLVARAGRSFDRALLPRRVHAAGAGSPPSPSRTRP